jgi:predicted enzyme related to lactoylglutathione lyase
MNKATNSLNWFEISVAEIYRAKRFYETIFNIEMGQIKDFLDMKMCGFPWETYSGKAYGALAQSQMHIPSTNGSIIYLNANPDMQRVLDRIEPAGGKVLIPKTEIAPEAGYMAFFIDSEGNKMALHSNA